jgi:dienelactone hydrolase
MSSLLFLAGWATAASEFTITTTVPNGTLEEIPATLSKPDGPGPFPAIVLIGEKDDWTPAEPFRKLAEAAQAAGHAVAIKMYPGAYHSFDSPYPVRCVAARINPSVPGGRGATTDGDPRAWLDSIREVGAFFGRHL